MNNVKKEIITIAGNLGSGKSTTGKILAGILGYKRYSSGDFMRKIAEERKITLAELSAEAEADESIDREIDEYVKKIENKNKIVIDSRLAYHWIPESFKVFLSLPTQVGAERMLADLQKNPTRAHEQKETPKSVEDVAKPVEERLASERKRYKELYGIANHTDPKNFDLVVDTEKNDAQKVAGIILEKYKEWLKN